MTDAFMANATIKKAYEIKADDVFEKRFSSVSLESIIFHTVATCAYALEQLFEAFKEDVTARIDANVVPTQRWYHTQALAFQYGDELIYDEEHLRYRYAEEKEDNRIVQYAAVWDAGGSIIILVAKDKGGKPTPLSSDELSAFSSYMNSVKIAGVVLNIKSLPADNVRIVASIEVDPMVMNSTGVRLSDGKQPVVDAIHHYLAHIQYGGVFNKTKLVDAIQAVDGVIDVQLGECSARPSGGDWKTIEGNNYTATSGCLIAENLTNSLTYVLQVRPH